MDLSATEHLDRLAKAFADAGWSSRPRYEEVPAALRVFHADWPRYGDTITVTVNTDGEPCFRSSTGAPLAPVSDTARAVERFEALMEAFRPIVEQLGLRDPVHHRRCRWPRPRGGGAR